MNNPVLRHMSAPSWADRIPTTDWNGGFGYIEDEKITIPVQDPLSLEIALAQAGDVWACVAKCNGTNQTQTYFTFSILSFIGLWNGIQPVRQTEPTCTIELFNSVVEPILYRHPAIMPMEMSFCRSAEKFNRSMIYSLSRLDNYRI